MQYHRLSKRDARILAERIASTGLRVSGERASVMEDEGLRLYSLGGAIIIELGKLYIPVIDESVNNELLTSLPSVTVDMGAVKHIVNGADVMRPGIVSFEPRFEKNDLVVVRDVRYRRAIAICRALVSSDEAESMSHGKILENLHYVGDKYWRLSRKLLEIEKT